MPQSHPYQRYQQVNVETADQRQMILMLYDGAIRFLTKAGAKIEAKDFEGAHNYLIRSRQIVSELLATLRPELGGEIGQNLKRLYVYAFNRIVEANLRKDSALIQEVLRILTTLREGWAGLKSTAQRPGQQDEPPMQINLRG